MKRIALMIVAVIGLLATQAAKAQVAMINPNGFALDTATQAAAEGPKTPSVKGTAKTFSMEIVTTKISGTLTGTIVWECSNDGVNFVPIPGSSAATITDQSGVKAYVYDQVDKRYLYYAAIVTLGGTGSLSYSAKYYVTLPTISNVNN